MGTNPAFFFCKSQSFPNLAIMRLLFHLTHPPIHFQSRASPSHGDTIDKSIVHCSKQSQNICCHINTYRQFRVFNSTHMHISALESKGNPQKQKAKLLEKNHGRFPSTWFENGNSGEPRKTISQYINQVKRRSFFFIYSHWPELWVVIAQVISTSPCNAASSGIWGGAAGQRPRLIKVDGSCPNRAASLTAFVIVSKREKFIIIPKAWLMGSLQAKTSDSSTAEQTGTKPLCWLLSILSVCRTRSTCQRTWTHAVHS